MAEFFRGFLCSSPGVGHFLFVLQFPNAPSWLAGGWPSTTKGLHNSHESRWVRLAGFTIFTVCACSTPLLLCASPVQLDMVNSGAVVGTGLGVAQLYTAVTDFFNQQKASLTAKGCAGSDQVPFLEPRSIGSVHVRMLHPCRFPLAVGTVGFSSSREARLDGGRHSD